jgi:hypothetical protein
MIDVFLIIVIAIILYLVPGYLLLSWFDLPGLSAYNRFFVALGVSLIFLPTVFVAVANIFPYQPGFWAWLVCVAVMAGLGILCRARGKFRMIWGDLEAGSNEPRRLEKWGMGLFLFIFAAFVNLPRLLMFLQGGQTLAVSPWDEHWHIAELVSVARTGIPPMHYFFPSIRLVYYYISWIYPAILTNLPVVDISLMRAMSLHVFIQIFAFLGLIYVVLQYNFKQAWLRWLGIAFFTVMGGLDLYAKLPGIDFVDWWQRDPSWLNGERIQISQFATLYAWVPHHIAAAMVLPFLVLLWKNTQTSYLIKAVATGLMLGFSLVTSPFVFLFLAIVLVIAFVTRWRVLWENRGEVFFALVIMALLFVMITWHTVWVFSGHRSNLIWNDLRISLIERIRGDAQPYFLADRWLTILGLPLVGSAVLLVDMGLAFVLYLLWWGRRMLGQEHLGDTVEYAVLGIFPLVSILLVFLIRDDGGGTNFAMRGMIPAQMIIVYTALRLLQEMAHFLQSFAWRRYALAYVVVCFITAQSFSMFAEIRSVSVDVVKLALWQECGWKTLLTRVSFDDYCLIKDEFRYIPWLNGNTEKKALILEAGPLPEDTVRFRWLERSRLLLPVDFSTLALSGYDKDFIAETEWQELMAQSAEMPDVLGWYHALQFRDKDKRPVYLVVRQEMVLPDSAVLKYQDDFVKIFALGSAIPNSK